MPERLLGSSMGLLQKGMEEILDWNEEKEKKSPSFSGAKAQCGWDSMCSSSKHCSGVGRIKAPPEQQKLGKEGVRGLMWALATDSLTPISSRKVSPET